MKTTYHSSAANLAITRQRVAATAVVTDGQGRILLHQRSDNSLWGLPGGGIESGESVREAVEREVFEETGYRVHADHAISIDSEPERFQLVQYPDGNVIHYIAITVACTLMKDTPEGDAEQIAEETLEIGWFELALDESGAITGVPGGEDNLIAPHRLRLQAYLANSPLSNGLPLY